jgi:5-methyltetrahydrofolate--homocysteine methyltransferase
MSALLTTTMVNMRGTIEALTEAGLRDSLKIMIGGAPVTAAFAEEIGADAYAPDAASAVDVARSLAG